MGGRSVSPSPPAAAAGARHNAAQAASQRRCSRSRRPRENLLEHGGARRGCCAQLARFDGVKSVATNPFTGSLIVGYDPKALLPGRIIEVLRRAGYAIPMPTDATNDNPRSEDGWLEQLATAAGRSLVGAFAEQLAVVLIRALV
jgi:hypothetical protein